MEMITDAWLQILVVGSLVAAASTCLKFLAARSRKRASDLAAVEVALGRHYEAVKAIQSDPALPEQLKKAINLMSAGLQDRELARMFACEFQSGNLFKSAAGKPQIEDDVKALLKTRPDVVRNVRTAFTTAIIVMFLRWPENAAIFERAMAEMASDQKKEMAAIGFASSKLREKAERLFQGPTPLSA